MNEDLRLPAIILRPKSPRLETIFSRAQIGTLVDHLGFLAKIDANSYPIAAKIAVIEDNFLTGPNWHFGEPIWVFCQNRCKLMPNRRENCRD